MMLNCPLPGINILIFLHTFFFFNLIQFHHDMLLQSILSTYLHCWNHSLTSEHPGMFVPTVELQNSWHSGTWHWGLWHNRKYRKPYCWFAYAASKIGRVPLQTAKGNKDGRSKLTTKNIYTSLDLHKIKTLWKNK